MYGANWSGSTSEAEVTAALGELEDLPAGTSTMVVLITDRDLSHGDNEVGGFDDQGDPCIDFHDD